MTVKKYLELFVLNYLNCKDFKEVEKKYKFKSLVDPTLYWDLGNFAFLKMYASLGFSLTNDAHGKEAMICADVMNAFEEELTKARIVAKLPYNCTVDLVFDQKEPLDYFDKDYCELNDAEYTHLITLLFITGYWLFNYIEKI